MFGDIFIFSSFAYIHARLPKKLWVHFSPLWLCLLFRTIHINETITWTQKFCFFYLTSWFKSNAGRYVYIFVSEFSAQPPMSQLCHTSVLMDGGCFHHSATLNKALIPWNVLKAWRTVSTAATPLHRPCGSVGVLGFPPSPPQLLVPVSLLTASLVSRKSYPFSFNLNFHNDQ